MRQLLILLFCGLPGFALAQTSATPASGSNPDADAPVNVSAPALQPAQPAMHQSVPVKNHGQFYVKDDKPATPAGQIAPPRQRNAISKEELVKRSMEAPASETATQQKAKKASSQTKGPVSSGSR